MLIIYLYISFRWKRSFLFSLIFGLPVLITNFTYMFLMKIHVHDVMLIPGLSLENVIIFALCSIVQVIRNSY